MIGRCFGVGWADADIDQRDARPVCPFQVIGRHLRGLQRLRQGRIGIGDLGIAGRDKGGVAALGVAQHLAGVLLKLGHIELVVGEQHMCLEMLGIRGRVMRQPGEGVIDALRGKGRERAHVVLRHVGPVDDIIIGGRQVRHVKDIAQGEIGGPFLGHVQRIITRHGEMYRNRCGRRANDHWLVVIFNQQADLLDQIVPKQVRPGDRRGEGAGRGDMSERQPRIDMGVRRGAKPQFGIKGTHAGIGGRSLHRLGKGIMQEGRGLLIEFGQAVHGSCRIAEAFRVRGVRGQDRCHVCGSNNGMISNFCTSTSPRSEIRNSGITTRAKRECCI